MLFLMNAEDIRGADRTVWGCPVARTIQRTVPFCDHAFAGVRAVSWRVGAMVHDRPTPPDAAAFMRRWDAGEAVEPFGFELPD